ncbi:MAG: c-type cytochrome domain-containing protein [Imperialibacter sp.]|uniref:c-type cytochrome domain-containing protein n=1 Tax=Imperialibacter sp. TaxID=2038411 RepID=UPI0032ED7640
MDYGIVSFIGKFHPLLVHLPIGMLIIAILFGFMSLKENYSYLKGANHIVLFLAAISATLSAFTGWILSQSGGYANELIDWHQWMGIGLVVISWVAFFVHARNEKAFKMVLIVSGLLLVVTGHLGGSITHGDGFLTPPPLSEWFVKEGAAVPPIVLTKETLGYEAIANIVDRKCKSCHGPGSQKGKLRLDSPEEMLKGGKHGEVIVASLPEESHLIENILLPIDNDDHMPPKEKSQLSKAEMAILVEWVATGASFDKTVEELVWSDSLIMAYNAATSNKPATYTYTFQGSVQPVEASLVTRLDTLGVSIVPVSDGSNYLNVNFLHVPEQYMTEAFQLLTSINKQCVWLDLTGKALQPEHLEYLGKMQNLTKLSLKDCGLNDSLMSKLQPLSRLEYVNLVNNPVTADGIKTLQGNAGLQQLFLFQTEVQPTDTAALREIFEKALIDLGGYEMPLIEADTSKIIY